MISVRDIAELKRLSTNLYDADKDLLNRVISEIGRMNSKMKKIETQEYKNKEENG